MKRLQTNLGRAGAVGLAMALAMVPATALAADYDWSKHIQYSKTALTDFTKEDPGLNKVLDGAAGYVVFPSVGKAGLIVGGASGEGVLFEKGYAIGTAKMRQLTVGAQIGGQTFSELIIFKDQSALDDFKRNAFAFQAGTSAVSGGKGASNSIEYQKGVAVLTLAKSGLMAEATIGGQKFDFVAFAKPIPSV